MFTLSRVGVPVALAGIAYMLLAGRRLLPARPAPLGDEDERRDYMVALQGRARARRWSA